MRLNRNKAFATVHPPYNSAYFNQGGHYFDNDGNEVNVETGVLIPHIEEAVAAQPVTPAPKAPVEADDDPDASLEPALDLVKWADGEEKASWATLVAAVQSKYGIVPKSKKHAIEIIKAPNVAAA